jgi:hypothetical protein
MISDCELDRTLAMVRDSGVAAELEALLRANTGGAPRALSVELLFAACILVNGRGYSSATFVDIHRLLTRDIVASRQFRLGVAWKSGTGVRKLAIHQVRYLFKRIRKSLDYSPHTGRVWGAGKERAIGRALTQDERIEREDEFVALMARLVTSSTRGVEPTSRVAIDATGMASPARRRKQVKANEGDDYRLETSIFVRFRTKASDQDARSGYQTATQDKGDSSKVSGYQLLTASTVYDRGSCEQKLKLINAMYLVPANAVLAGPTLRMIDDLTSRQEVTDVLVDRGFSNSTSEHWADRLLERNIDQVFDLMQKQRGKYLDLATGAILIDGWPCVPWTPEHLHNIPAPPHFALAKPGPNATADEIREYDKNLAALLKFKALQAELSLYALRPNGRRKANGSRHFFTNSYQKHRATAAQRRTAICTKSTITITANIRPNLRQQHRWGSDAWIRAFTQRSAVESGYGNIKSQYGENIKRGWIRVVGLTATGLMLAFAVMHYNLRMLRKWAALNAKTQEHPHLEAEPEIFGYEPVTADVAEALAVAARPPTAA